LLRRREEIAVGTELNRRELIALVACRIACTAFTKGSCLEIL
jgi:hypothetical protein